MFMARLMQVYHPCPIPFNVAVFLTRARAMFNEISARSRGTTLISPRSAGMAETMAVGGYAFLRDVISLVG
jgi:hypothetical protein